MLTINFVQISIILIFFSQFCYRRTGFPEIVFAEGKSSEQLKHILEAMIFRKNTEFDSKDFNHFPIVASRVCTDKWSYIEEIDGLQVDI